MDIFKMRAAGPGPGPAARILKILISRSGFEGGDPLLNDVQWIRVYLCGLARIYVDLHGFTWILVDFHAFRGSRSQRVCQRKTRRPVIFASGRHGDLAPIRKNCSILEAWRLDLGSLEAWKLDLGSLEACLGGKPGSMLRRQAWWRHAGKHVSRTSNTLDAQRGRRICIGSEWICIGLN